VCAWVERFYSYGCVFTILLVFLLYHLFTTSLLCLHLLPLLLLSLRLSVLFYPRLLLVPSWRELECCECGGWSGLVVTLCVCCDCSYVPSRICCDRAVPTSVSHHWPNQPKRRYVSHTHIRTTSHAQTLIHDSYACLLGGGKWRSWMILQRITA
jgi:hypothetical protein